MLRISFGLVAVGLLGPTVAPAGEESAVRTVTFRPCEDEDGLPTQFRLAEAAFEAEERAVAAELVRVTFPSPVASGHVANDTVYAELHLPAPADARAGPAPAVVFLHYLDGDLALPRLFCRSLALRGVPALLLKMPYYHERRTGTDRRMVSPDFDLTAAAVRQAALDVRYARAYLAARPDVDGDRVGVAGISLGGVVGSLAFQLDRRLERGCFLLAGADLPTMLWESRLTTKYRAEAERAGLTKADLAAACRAVDPASYPGRRAGRPVLLLAGRGDDVVPAACTAALAAALEDPEVAWYAGGHRPTAADAGDALLRVTAFLSARPRPPAGRRR